MTKSDLEREIKALRKQMAALEQRCQEREERLFKVIESVSPFFEIMTEAQKKAFSEQLGIEYE